MPRLGNIFILFSAHSLVVLRHKVFTYIEYRAVSASSELLTPRPPFHPASLSSPRTKGGGVHTRRAVRGGGVNISEDARHWIGLLQYNPSTVEDKV